MNIEKIDLLEKCIAEVVPDSMHEYATLAPGIAAEKLNEFELEFELQLPESARDFYLARDGQQSHVLFLFLGFRLHQFDLIYNQFRKQQERANSDKFGVYDARTDVQLPREVKPVLLSNQWIPIGDNGGSTTLFLDIDPSEHGQIGQVLTSNAELEVVNVLASSFDNFLDLIIDGIESGSMSFDENAGVLA